VLERSQIGRKVFSPEMFDVEKLICEVEKRPPLYNITLKDYSNRELKAKCWTEICAEMYPDWNLMANEVKNEKGM